jgi:hypothetical protein
VDKSLLLLLNQSITLAPSTGLDGYGIETFGSAVTVKAIIFQKQKLVLNAQGDSVVSTAQTFVDGTTTVTTNSKITLPDGTTPIIFAVSSFPNELGAIDYKIIYT